MNRKFGVSIKWLSVSCFEIRCDGVSVVIDPFVTDCDSTELTWEAIENCDILCLSHPHFDHIMDIPRLVDKFHPLLLCGEQAAMPLAAWLNYSPTRIYPMCPNLELDFDTVKIRALYGRHSEQSAGFNDLRTALSKYRFCAEDAQVNAMQPIGSMEYRNYLLHILTHHNMAREYGRRLFDITKECFIFSFQCLMKVFFRCIQQILLRVGLSLYVSEK